MWETFLLHEFQLPEEKAGGTLAVKLFDDEEVAAISARSFFVDEFEEPAVLAHVEAMFKPTIAFHFLFCI
ncbi:hypothetical protein [Bacteroides heparinolyticus]|uniref:hypothetical protein n=1 Tax=Prevotella heparinolytica TaxID=28113 RepID=UPI0023F08312|nr:hypothetical protein [Bacteroides heparinolyticus]